MLILGGASKSVGCSPNIQQPAAANVHSKSFTWLLNAAAFWLQSVSMNVDVLSCCCYRGNNIGLELFEFEKCHKLGTKSMKEGANLDTSDVDLIIS